MSETPFGRILIDPSIDGSRQFEAERLAHELEDHVRQHPQLALEALRAIEAGQQTVDADSTTAVETAGSPTPHIAATIGKLLERTDYGGYLDFDDKTYDVLFLDPHHRQLMHDARNADHRKGSNPQLNRQRVALSGLAIFIRLWGARSVNEQPDDTAHTA